MKRFGGGPPPPASSTLSKRGGVGGGPPILSPTFGGSGRNRISSSSSPSEPYAFSYGTVPRRTFGGNGSVSSRGPTSPSPLTSPSYARGQFGNGSNFNTFSPRRGHTYMSSFGGRGGGTVSGNRGRPQVVEGGMVINRFQRPPEGSHNRNSGSATVSSSSSSTFRNRSSVTNPDFYTQPSPQSSSKWKQRQVESPTSSLPPPPPSPPALESPPQLVKPQSSPASAHSFRTEGDNSFDADCDRVVSAISPLYYNQAVDEEEDMSYSSYPPPPPGHPPSSRRSAPENKSSLLLSSDENQVIFETLGKGRQTLATAVVRLLVPSPDQTKWQVKDTGVACLVRDTSKKSYFIQVFHLASRSMIFRQEIYNQFEYEMPMQCFLTFEADNFTVGINFADPTEAVNFREALDSKLEAKRQRRSEREHQRRSRLLADTSNNQQSYNYNHNNNNNNSMSQPSVNKYVPQQQQYQPQYAPTPAQSQPAMNGGVTTVSTTYNFPTTATSKTKSKNKGGKEKDKKGKTGLRKEDIGQPTNFRHIQHVGWDPTKGFDLNGVDDDLKEFFSKAGVSSDALKDDNTREYIYQFINEHGGLDKIKQIASSRPAAPPPPSSASVPAPPPIPNRAIPAGHKTSAPAPPPPPSHVPSRPVPPVPYNQNVTPPPPPMRTHSNVAERSPQLQQSRTYNQSNGPARPPPPTFNPKQNGASGPPPPPPPPMPGPGVCAPPPPPPQPPGGIGFEQPVVSKQAAVPAVHDDRSQLLQQIRSGAQLKHVDTAEAPAKKAGGGGLTDCLDQIRGGVGLKHVTHTPKEPANLDTMDGLAGALARALADRQRVINPDSSTDDDEEEEVDDDEWD